MVYVFLVGFYVTGLCNPVKSKLPQPTKEK